MNYRILDFSNRGKAQSKYREFVQQLNYTGNSVLHVDLGGGKELRIAPSTFSFILIHHDVLPGVTLLVVSDGLDEEMKFHQLRDYGPLEFVHDLDKIMNHDDTSSESDTQFGSPFINQEKKPMTYLVKLNISVAVANPNPPFQFPHQVGPKIDITQIGTVYIASVPPGFLGGYTEFTVVPKEAYAFANFWDAYESVNAILMGEVNNSTIRNLLFTAVDKYKGSTFIVSAEIHDADIYLSGDGKPQQPKVIVAYVRNYAPGLFVFQGNHTGYGNFQEWVQTRGEMNQLIMSEFFKMITTHAGHGETMILNVHPRPPATPPQMPFFNPSFNRLGAAGGFMLPNGQVTDRPQMMGQGMGLGHNQFPPLPATDSVTDNENLFVSVYVGGGRVILTWTDVSTPSSYSTIEFVDGKISGLDLPGDVTILAARIVAHRLRSGALTFRPIDRPTPTGYSEPMPGRFY